MNITGRHICDRRTTRWKIYHVPAVWPLYARRQAVVWRFAAAKFCRQTQIDRQRDRERITENNGCLAVLANTWLTGPPVGHVTVPETSQPGTLPAYHRALFEREPNPAVVMRSLICLTETPAETEISA